MPAAREQIQFRTHDDPATQPVDPLYSTPVQKAQARVRKAVAASRAKYSDPVVREEVEAESNEPSLPQCDDAGETDIRNLLFKARSVGIDCVDGQIQGIKSNYTFKLTKQRDSKLDGCTAWEAQGSIHFVFVKWNNVEGIDLNRVAYEFLPKFSDGKFVERGVVYLRNGLEEQAVVVIAEKDAARTKKILQSSAMTFDELILAGCHED